MSRFRIRSAGHHARFVLTMLASMVGGCATRAEVIQARETLHLGTRQMRAEHLEWAQQLAPGGDLTKLPALTAADLQLRRQWDQELEDYVKDSRAHDHDAFGATARP